MEDFQLGRWAATLDKALELKSRGWEVEVDKSPKTAANTIVKLLTEIANGK